MSGDVGLHRWSSLSISSLLGLTLMLGFFISRAVGLRRAGKESSEGLGSSLEAMASGLLGLLLAFNFSIAQSRFEDREKEIVREADAIGTMYLRCSLLDAEDRRLCRDHLRSYAALRIAAYASYGRAEASSLVNQLAKGEQIQNELWSMVTRAVREHPDAPRAVLMMGLNELIDLDADRRASIRIIVPQAVTVAIMLACIAWAVLLGYSLGLKRQGSWAGWVMVTVLIGVVFGVALDLDRPVTGLVTTAAAERSMKQVLEMMQRPPVD
jgi:hypothetical protein